MEEMFKLWDGVEYWFLYIRWYFLYCMKGNLRIVFSLGDGQVVNFEFNSCLFRLLLERLNVRVFFIVIFEYYI